MYRVIVGSVRQDAKSSLSSFHQAFFLPLQLLPFHPPALQITTTILAPAAFPMTRCLFMQRQSYSRSLRTEVATPSST
jgi:hypothetical protein